MRTIYIAAALYAAALPLWCQGRLVGNLDKLAAKADESVVVTLDKSMLRLTGRFLDEEDKEEIRKLVSGLDSVYVRSFEFSHEGEYDKADVEAIRSQLAAPPWARVVGVRSQRSNQNVDVYFKTGGEGQLGGVVVIAAEPKELTVVEINGNLDPHRLADLGGEFGIPKLARRGARTEEQ